MKRIFTAGALTLVAVTGAFTGIGRAQEDEGAFADHVEARHGFMIYRAMNIAVLGAMAKGEAPYDAAAAQKAADNLAASAAIDDSILWPEGSDNGNPEVKDTIALPLIWSDKAGFNAKYKDFREATVVMQAAAGQGLDSLKAGMGTLGPTCGGCHKVYRAPEE